jgi:hypothetical protein
MSSATVPPDEGQDRTSWKWWDRFWLRCGLGFAAAATLLEISRLVSGLPSQVASRPCVTETR